MSKLRENPTLPNHDSPNFRFQLTELLRISAIQTNSIAEGRIQANYNATTAAPTTGDYQQGDFIKNSTPTEEGTASAKYVLLGWICVAAGTPGTWKECRVLTGA